MFSLEYTSVCSKVVLESSFIALKTDIIKLSSQKSFNNLSSEKPAKFNSKQKVEFFLLCCYNLYKSNFTL